MKIGILASEHRIRILKYLFIICVVFAFFFSVLLFSKKEKVYEDWFLGFIFLILTINCLFVFLFSRSETLFYLPYFSELNYALPLLYAPLTWLYVKAMTSIDFQFKKIDWLHFLPFVVFLLVISAPLFSNFKLAPSSQLGYPLIKLLITPVYLGAIIVLIRKYNRKFLEEYSYEMEANLTWLNWLVVGAIILWVIATASYIYNLTTVTDKILLYDYYTLSFLAVYLFLLAYVAIRYTGLFA